MTERLHYFKDTSDGTLMRARDEYCFTDTAVLWGRGEWAPYSLSFNEHNSLSTLTFEDATALALRNLKPEGAVRWFALGVEQAMTAPRLTPEEHEAALAAVRAKMSAGG